jgi:hypothetical protein
MSSSRRGFSSLIDLAEALLKGRHDATASIWAIEIRSDCDIISGPITTA